MTAIEYAPLYVFVILPLGATLATWLISKATK